MEFGIRQKLFLVLATTFCTCLVVGDIIGGKLVSGDVFGFPFTTTVGMVPFPVTFLLTDLMNEFYGRRAARLVTVIGFFMATLAFAFIYLAASIPIAEFTHAADWKGVTESSFNNVFLGSLRMLTASLLAYLVSQFVDIGIFHLLRRWSGGKMLWLRATGSTAVSQLIDTITISLAAWVGTLTLTQIGEVMISAYGLKLGIAVVLTPLIYAGHRLVERGLGIRPIALDGTLS